MADQDGFEALRLTLDEEARMGARIKVVGVGGGGSNAVSRMVQAGISGVEFMVVGAIAAGSYGVPRSTRDVDMLLKRRQSRIPLPFMGDGRDTANAALFLASDEARARMDHHGYCRGLADAATRAGDQGRAESRYRQSLDRLERLGRRQGIRDRAGDRVPDAGGVNALLTAAIT